MKTLPIHTIPASRMAAMTSQATREMRAARVEQARRNWDGWDPDHGEGCGAMAVVGVVVVAILIYAGLFFLWI